MTRTWQDRVMDVLTSRFGQDRGLALGEKWVDRMPNYYTTSVPIELTPGDMLRLDELSDERPVVVGLQNEPESQEQLTRVAIYRLEGKRPLSDLMPILEALGFYVIEEVPFRLMGGDEQPFIHDFGVLGADRRPIDPDRWHRAYRRDHRGDHSRPGRVRLAQSLDRPQRPHLQPGGHPACLSHLLATGWTRLHRRVHERSVGRPSRYRHQVGGVVRGPFRPESRGGRHETPCAQRSWPTSMRWSHSTRTAFCGAFSA